MFSKYQKINLLPFTKLPTNSKDPSKNPLGDREYLCSMSVMRTWTQQFQRQAVMAGHLPDRTCAVHKNIQTLIKLLESSAKEWMKNNIRVAAVGHASFPLKRLSTVCVLVFVFVFCLCARVCVYSWPAYVYVCVYMCQLLQPGMRNWSQSPLLHTAARFYLHTRLLTMAMTFTWRK